MKSKNIHLLIAAILAVALYFILSQPVCLDMGLTTIGASTLAIFIATIYLWITYGTGWISLLSIGLLGFTGIAPANTILANSFGNSTTVIVIGTLMLCVALEETGVAKLIANWFISRKFVENRPYMFFAMFLISVRCSSLSLIFSI
jgi:sodium-dependent dicarboxylate transporter 2/3/5